MVYTVNDDRRLEWHSPLYDYIRSTYLYNGENLIYTNKYSVGTFSITTPNLDYKECEFINGYPHFKIPLDICLDEINYFIENNSIYDYNFIIRYGDTHPNKPIPKLAQVRNLILENSLNHLIGKNVTSYFTIGDISLKTLQDFIIKYNLNISADDLFKNLVNNNLNSDLKEKLCLYDYDALTRIKQFISNINLENKQFIFESDLYQNHNLYNSLKNNPNFQDELKKNGEIKYSLQELMFIENIIKSNNDILINIVGSNQSEHILKVKSLLNMHLEKLNTRFITYGICKNADESDLNNWKSFLENYIEENDFKINNQYLNYMQLLRIINVSINSDNIIDFSNLKKYKTHIRKYCDFINNFDVNVTSKNIDNCSELINMMALVCYNLNRSIEMGQPNYFYKYVFNIINKYNSDFEKYNNISKIYYDFVNSSLIRMGLINDLEAKRKVLIK